MHGLVSLPDSKWSGKLIQETFPLHKPVWYSRGCSIRGMHMPLFLAATMKRLWRMKRKREKGRERERERERDGEVKHLSRLCVARGLREAKTAEEEFSDCENTAAEGGARCNWFSAHGLNKRRGREDGWTYGKTNRLDSFPKIYSPSNQKLPSFHPKSLILFPFCNTTLLCMI